jgi:hypothetical protein
MIILKVLICIVIGIICGLAGSYSGADGTSKAWRRFGIPLFLSILSAFILKSFKGFLNLLMSLSYIQGYGIPDGPPPLDQGSLIGRFWYKVFKGNMDEANFWTRATIGLIKSLVVAILSVAITQNIVLRSMISSLIVLNTLLWGYFVKNEGMFKFLGKDCLWEEFYIYFGDAILIMILVLFR